ncbi:uncharacterized protein LOC133887709 [Phragmites australis]|uniref:uncharacterized protein LOC133887709 n=1 Tax=Phragmites australis TaxID=29695 RepID=UPI002D783174|nr:uncharacterized protein LOC133887709 [Phragmites australis]
MGCFLTCFGGDGDRRRRRRKLRRQSPARSPPRPNHVAGVHEASVVVKKASPPLHGAKPSTPLSAGVVVEEVSPPPLHEGKVSMQLSADVVVKETLPSLHEAKASMPPSFVEVVGEVVADACPGKELRNQSEQKASPVRSLPLEKQIAPPLSPVKCSPVVSAAVSAPDSVECSPVVAAAVFTPDSVKCSPAAAAAVSTSDSELREVNEHGSRSSGKKKVTFDMHATTYENAALPDQDDEPPEDIDDEDEKQAHKTVVLPENHRYRNCSDSDDDVEDEYAEDDVYGDDSDEEEEDFVDCKIDLLDEEEMGTEENKQESHESLFSLSMSNDQQNDQEVISPAPKSSGGSVEEESPLIRRNNPRDRSQYVRPVLNPVQNLSQWKEVKSLKTQAVPDKKLDKENVNSVLDVGASPGSKLSSQTKISPCNTSKRGVSVDASLSTWLVSSENSTVDKVQSKSPCSVSSVSREERPVLGALTVDDLKQSSAASSPRRSPSHNREGAPMLGTVGSYWSCTMQDNGYCSSRSDSGTNGIPNTTSKYREDKRVNWPSTPFNVKLDRALKKTSA